MKLGRLARTFDPRVPHHGVLKAMLRAKEIARPPLLLRCNNAASLSSVGMMLNDQLGCCTVAGRYHGIQVDTDLALGTEYTEPDSLVLQMYQELGYRGGLGEAYDATTDHGCVEQDVLNYLVNTGSPMYGGARSKIYSYVEIDVEHLDDVCEVIQEFGFAYVGFNVPDGFMQDVGGGVVVWNAKPSYGRIIGGHCVILTGFDRSDTDNPTFDVISWGQTNYVMTTAFFRRYVDEAYGLVDPLWIAKTSQTPYGLDLPSLQSLASALKE